ncbi:phospholipase D family protein [Thalassotalea crassostreae]|uniref:phospholipase D family protein n=1 Tax=Thalassotalea crassostreae TaxID=1763536 RepID=UPI0008385C63|nr:phospholipase D family protein [Thalassotalea crassostreae]
MANTGNDTEHAHQLSHQCHDNKFSSNTSFSERLEPFEERMKTQTGVYVLEGETEALVTRAWLTKNAQRTIDVQYFIFSTDNIGLIATDYLVRAAERGIKVRIIVDDIMVDAEGDELLKLDSHPNISIKIYNPLANIGKNILQKVFNLTVKFHDFNQRMHNKAFIVDGKAVITGGRNIADEYFGYDHQYNFRDRDVFLLGQASTQVQNSFDLFWQHKLSVPVADLIDDKVAPLKVENLHKYACDPKNFLPIVRQQIEQVPHMYNQMQQSGQIKWLEDVEFITDVPGKNSKGKYLAGGGISTDKLIELISNAKKSVIIQTPYLITTSKTRKLLKKLVKDGIEIQILTNSLASTDNLEAFSGYQRDREDLLKTGVKIFELKPDAQIRQLIMADAWQTSVDKLPDVTFGLHAKSMVIDDEITVIGTFNVDPRSANLNTESITVIPSKEIALDVKIGMLKEMLPENAWHVTEQFNPDSTVSMSKRMRVKLRRIIPKSIL